MQSLELMLGQQLRNPIRCKESLMNCFCFLDFDGIDVCCVIHKVFKKVDMSGSRTDMLNREGYDFFCGGIRILGVILSVS